MPFLSILLVWLLFALIVGVETRARNSITLIILLIFIAKTLTTIAGKILAPEDSLQRLISCPEELAAYFYIWAKRFIYYSVYGYMPLGIFIQIGLTGALLPVLWAIYKLGLIALAAIFVLQWKDTLKDKLSIEEQDGVLKHSLARVYNLILGKLYIVIILYFLTLITIAAFAYTGTALQLIFRMIGSLIIIAVGVGLWQLVRFLFNKLFSVSDRVKERFPGLEAKVNKYISFVQIAINIFLFLITATFILETWGLDLADFIVAGIGGIIIKKLVSIGITVVLALLAIDASQYFIQRMLEEKAGDQDKGIELSKRVKTFLPLFNNLVKYVTFFIAGMIILGQFGVDITPILAGAGVIGLAVGFGAQSLVKDVISGFFILFEDLISVGDVVNIKGTGGLVEAVNLRTIRMRDLSGNVHVIPNSNIDMITNMTKEYSRFVLDLGVSYREDVDEVIQIVKEVAEELRADPYYGQNMIAPLEVLGVDDFGESQVTIKFRITTKPIKQWETARELRRRIKKAFDAKDIEIPYPHHTIYIGDPKYKAPQPLTIKLESKPASIAQDDKKP
jgi:small conductance mechanosensitive channel